MLIILLFSAISISLANGARTPPTHSPGPRWWGPGFHLHEDKFGMICSEYVDGMLRAAVPFLLTSLLNLSVLGNREKRIDNTLIQFALAQAYLCNFSFCLICVIENNYRQADRPLGRARIALSKAAGFNDAGEDRDFWISRPLAWLCQLLAMSIPIAINVSHRRNRAPCVYAGRCLSLNSARVLNTQITMYAERTPRSCWSTIRQRRFSRR